MCRERPKAAGFNTGFGREGSWPSWLPSPLRIAIDHAFVSNDLAVVARRLGPKIGSDHLRLIFELAPAATNPGMRSQTEKN
jgi:endonuclease/exonuclease/phosphatase family metal-dependent hydrolase